MQRNYSNKEFPVHLQVFNKENQNFGHFLAMFEWVLLNHVNNTLQENELVKYKDKKYFNFTDAGVFIFTFLFL